jgi:hypothetical protein
MNKKMFLSLCIIFSIISIQLNYAIAPPLDEERVIVLTMGSTTAFVNDAAMTLDAAPFIGEGNRTMVPIRFIAEAMYADVTWNPTTRSVTIVTSNGDATILVVGNALPNNMGTPEIVGGRVFVPVRFVAATMGARTNWDGNTGIVTIVWSKDGTAVNVGTVVTPPEPPTTVVENTTNFNAWAIGAGAIFAAAHPSPCPSGCNYDPYVFGMGVQPDIIRGTLRNSWSVRNRDDLIATIGRMIDNGHTVSFAEAYGLVSNLSDFEYELLLTAADASGERHMWETTRAFGEKWGDKQIKAWDWFRMIHLASWGYSAGYVTQEEAYELMVPVIERLRATFSSWDEANRNYLDGYAWWSRTNVSQAGTEYAHRVAVYNELITRTGERNLFDPDVWK